MLGKKKSFVFVVVFVLLLLLACNLSQAAGPAEADAPVQEGVPADAPADSPGAEAPSGSTVVLEDLPVELLGPDDLVYQGAFRLPDGDPEDNSWAWGGEALTYYPDGDPGGEGDGFPGSLFGAGHNWFQYISEITIPAPVISSNPEDLNTVEVLQGFQDIRGSVFPFGEFEIPRVGLEYLPAQGEQDSGKLHFAWGQHYQDDRVVSHGWAELDLSSPQPAGGWYLSDITNYATDDYIFAIPEEWAAVYTPGQLLATGRFRDGGWSGEGPSIFAYGPWNQGNPPAPGTSLDATTLLWYGSSYDENPVAMDNYHHSDEWSGGAWLTAGEKSAVIFVGTKGLGEYWYGFANGVVWPDDPPYPEIPPYPNDDRGWWSNQLVGQIIFYNPADLGAVARGELLPSDPQPYASLNISDVFLGSDAPQRKYQTGGVAFDRANGYLYVLELFGEGEKPVMHVWQVQE